MFCSNFATISGNLTSGILESIPSIREVNDAEKFRIFSETSCDWSTVAFPSTEDFTPPITPNALAIFS